MSPRIRYWKSVLNQWDFATKYYQVYQPFLNHCNSSIIIG